MADLFNEDFLDFINGLNKAEVEYILVAGYGVILHGYARSTADMNVWVNKTPANHYKLKKTFLSYSASQYFRKNISSKVTLTFGLLAKNLTG